MSVRIDWWPVDRIEELQAFIDAEWRHGHVLARDEALLRWQHRSLRDPTRLAVLRAEDGGRPVAMLGFVEFEACVDRDRARGGWMTNWLVVPEARGAGLGRALVEHVRGSEYEVIGALAANAATESVLGRAGFDLVGMHRWVRVFDLDTLRELLRGREYPEEAWSAWTRGPRTEADGAAGFVGACRDDAFLRWRYDEHPSFDYDVLRGASGFAAWRIETVHGTSATVMRVVDFTGDAELAAEVVDAAGRAGVVFADFSCVSPGFGAPLEAVGFQREDRLPAELPGRFQPLDFSDRRVVSCLWIGLDARYADGDVYITRADSDLDRPN